MSSEFIKLLNISEEVCQLTGCSSIEQLNEFVDKGLIKDVIDRQEAIHSQKLKQLAQIIKDSNKRVVLICGPSSSGKTTFAKKLCSELEAFNLKTLYMGTDDYYVEKEQMPIGKDGKNDYECIEAIDVDLFQRNINELIEGKEVDMPIFDFESMHKIYGQNYKRISNDTIIVIEGILTLHKRLTATIADEDKYRIYISPVSMINEKTGLSQKDIRLIRRICRDYRARNAKVERTIELWPKVKEGETNNIFPNTSMADAEFNTYCIYEPVVLISYIKPLLMSVDTNNPYFSEAQRLLETIDLYKPIEYSEEKYIPKDSIVREFIGGSILVD